MKQGYERRRDRRRFSIKDIDRFNDLEWEESMADRAAQKSGKRKKPLNVSSMIEDYLQAYF